MPRDTYSTMLLNGEVSRLVEAPEFDRTRPADGQLPLPDGFKGFNHCDTLCVSVPDGGFTISAQTKSGKRVTFHFGVYRDGGSPQFVDVQYHDNGTAWDNGGAHVPTFDAITFGGGNTISDTRLDAAKETSPKTAGRAAIVCVLIEDRSPRPNATAAD